ncbi:NAD(P)/FAD-dependent oxidoreductase [Streptomyces sp. NPDC020817]|uniref:NAD(P)/FAD-dependent oxidoreductase n=1 Tax=Streptomyces sp. NPDC020817 TaxID=3365095 RepID=UPI0037B0662F
MPATALTAASDSFWESAVDLDSASPAPSAEPLSGPLDVDVAVIGGGYTGLWTAYYLKKAQPSLNVVVLERRSCGFGASGRNGGWLYSGFAGRSVFAERYGIQRAIAMQRAMNAAVDEVLNVCAAEGIDAHQTKGGVLEVACTPAQVERLDAFVAAEHAFGQTHVERLDAARAAERIAIPGVLGASWDPGGARIQPALLVRGLAAAARRVGVDIYEHTAVTRILPAKDGGLARAVTDRGTVSAPYVLRCTEGFTADLPRERRSWLPMNSSLIVTAPLPASFWQSAGWEGREVLGDFAHAYMYAQRTADDRIALGGRGVPYRFGSRTDVVGATPRRTVEQLTTILHRMFPGTRGVAVEQAWSGVLGVPRDWCSTVALDHDSGLGWAGGYVGSGVAAANLAARTLRDLTLGPKTELTELPWVGHRVRRWEPEPLRWIGVHGLYAAYHLSDVLEGRGCRRTPVLARIADAVTGRY